MPSAAAQRTTLTGQLQAAGYQFPFDVSGLISDAIANGGSDPASYFLARVYRSPQFRQHYQGIFRADGTLKMTPAAYENYVDAASAAARSAGFRVTRQQVGQLIANNVSGDEFAFRLEAAGRIRANRQVLNSVNAQLKQRGFAPITSGQQALAFFSGKENKEVYDIFEAASVQAAFEGEGLRTSASFAAGTAALTPGVLSFEDIQKGAAQIRDALDLASVELGAEKVSRRELDIAVFGGPNQGQVQRKIQRILAQRREQAQTTPLAAQPELTQEGRVIAGRQAQPGL